MIGIAILVIITLATLTYVLRLPRAHEENWKKKIACFLVHSFTTLGFYGTGAGCAALHHLNISRLDSTGPGIGFAWFCVLVGLFCLRHWLGVIFDRTKTCWYSD